LDGATSILATVVLAGTVVAVSIGLFMYPSIREATAQKVVASAEEQTHLLETIREIAPSG